MEREQQTQMDPQLLEALITVAKQSGLTIMPIMDRKAFARSVGITEHTLTKLISRDYIPAVKLDNGSRASRFSPVNVAALWQVCLEQADHWQDEKAAHK